MPPHPSSHVFVVVRPVMRRMPAAHASVAISVPSLITARIGIARAVILAIGVWIKLSAIARVRDNPRKRVSIPSECNSRDDCSAKESELHDELREK